ncbi:hypothetical protein ACFOSC_22265 [Streptantibioticus rubrisoli]|uniref:Bacterial Ig domain-containing protein n=1 Tax=Streptantibioticus rubrisoli TaxID=1387313 RepID=A0ABT1P5Q5_9ACTN|nr:hypothetical protein [Streptantibioticus rubrisoli]MCQ4040685.1 hypothetical protein [Streptantibioticus rubrisoli]
MISTKSRSARLGVAAALSAALLTGGTATAFAAPNTVHPAPRPVPHRAPAKSSITFRVRPSSLRSGQRITAAGQGTGLAIGSRVQLQRRIGSRWSSLPASTALRRGGVYSLTTPLSIRGRQILRVLDGTTASSPVTVTVR